MTLIDRFLPEYHFHKKHRITVHASPETVYNTVTSLDIGKSVLIRILFLLRGMPRPTLTFSGLKDSGFSLLGEVPGNEMLLGVAGRFWRLKGNLKKIDKENFTAFARPGYAKAVWNFSLRETKGNVTELSTETRIYCTDRKSYCLFRLYWFLIGPFSGWIRRKMLSIVKTEAEKQHSDLPQPAQKEQRDMLTDVGMSEK